MRALLIAAAAMLASGSAWAECIPAPVADPFQVSTPVEPTGLAAGAAGGEAQRDRRGRIVAPVFVNGEGPFRFIVDTGANRSVLSPGLAQRLGLTAYGEGPVHTIHGQTIAPMVAVNSLTYGELSLPSDQMPLLGGAVLAGEQGLLGVDGLRDRRLRMDFEHDCIEIVPSRSAGPLRGWARLDGEIRFGHLLMVRGSVRGFPVNVLIDTGSDTTLANRALSEALRARMRNPIRGPDDFNRAYTAGEPIVLDASMLLPRLQLGELDMANVVAYVGDFHVFSLWGLENEPTLLVGMDVISHARAIAIDYGRNAVYFRLDGGARRRARTLQAEGVTDPGCCARFRIGND
jgi:predicted aspartyl protease